MKNLVNVVFFMVILFSNQLVVAQNNSSFNLGVKGGINTPWVRNLTDGVDRDGLKVGAVFGIWTRFNLQAEGIYLQPELLYSQTGGKVIVLGSSNNDPQLVEQNLTSHNLDAVLLIGQRFKIGKSTFRLNAGPVFSRVLIANVRVLDLRDDVTRFTNNFQYALQFGLGLDIQRMNLDLRYQHNFNRFYTADNIDPNELSAIQFTLGYKIF